MDLEKIRALASIMKEFDLSGLKIEEEDLKISLEKQQEMAFGTLPIQQTSFQQISGTNIPVGEAVSSQPENARGIEIKTPMVGVFYGAPSPESHPFVEVGSRVKRGDILCIIEAMKLMNEITSEYDGIIVELCVENGEVVEAGQPIFRMEIIE